MQSNSSKRQKAWKTVQELLPSFPSEHALGKELGLASTTFHDFMRQRGEKSSNQTLNKIISNGRSLLRVKDEGVKHTKKEQEAWNITQKVRQIPGIKTDSEIARALGISRRTFGDYLKREGYNTSEATLQKIISSGEKIFGKEKPFYASAKPTVDAQNPDSVIDKDRILNNLCAQLSASTNILRHVYPAPEEILEGDKLRIIKIIRDLAAAAGISKLTLTQMEQSHGTQDPETFELLRSIF